MTKQQLQDTKTLTGKLALFFLGLSVSIGLLISMVFIVALQWSEDLMSERRMHIDMQMAIQTFKQKQVGHVQLDLYTDAYNELSLLPDNIRKYIFNKQPFIDEIYFGDDSRMVSFSYYQDNGQSKPLILLSKVEQVEFSTAELIYASLIMMFLSGTSMFILATVLFKFSTKVIAPISILSKQLEQAKGDPNYQFKTQAKSATEFHQLVKELNQYRTELRALIKREQAFAKYASHELRTPLTISKGANTLLLQTKLTEYQQKQLLRSQSAIGEMTEIVDALLSLVRYERNQIQHVSRIFSAAELNQIVEQNQALAQQKQLNLTIKIISQPTIKADPVVMSMLINNLIRNAIAASNDKDQITITLTQAHIQIVDQGRGLSSKHQPQGHGLGLLIIEDICMRYQWQFNLLNNETHGCIAKINFNQIINKEL